MHWCDCWCSSHSMDANNSNPTAQQSVILTLAVVLLCRAMWKFLHRVDPDATPDDQQQQIRIGGSGTADQNGSGSARSLSIDASATTTSTKTVTSIKTTTTTDDHQLINRPGQQQHQQQTNILDQDLNNNDKSETDVTPPDTVDGTIVESPFLKNFKQNKIAQGKSIIFFFCLAFGLLLYFLSIASVLNLNPLVSEV